MPAQKQLFASGKAHRISFKHPVLVLHHLYNDELAVAGARLEVALRNGTLLIEHLDENGEAEVMGMRSSPVKMLYGLDPRPYEILDMERNPWYSAVFTR